MANPVGHIPVAYPTAEQGLHSVQHVVRHATGAEPLPASQLVAHAWVVAGAGLGTVYPPDGPMGSPSASLTAEEQATLEEFVQESRRPELKADPQRWKDLAKIVLTILLRFLCLAVVLGVFAAHATAAAPQAPRPPQAPPTIAEKATPGPVKVKVERQAKSCECSPACTCGCNSGEPCECRTVRGAAALPMAQQPVYQSSPRLLPAASFRGGFSRGGGC